MNKLDLTTSTDGVTMRKFIFLIGNRDEFESLEALMKAHFELGDRISSKRNASAFEFELPENNDRGIAFLVGCGIAFSNDWCCDDARFTLLEA